MVYVGYMYHVLDVLRLKSITRRNTIWIKSAIYHIFIPCLPLEMSTYWQSLGWIKVLRIWNRPRILMELGVRGRPLLPQTSWGRAEAKKVKAPSCASLRELIVNWGWEQQVFTISIIYMKNISAKLTSAKCPYSRRITQYAALDNYNNNCL